jgi:hypothetical protein
LDDHWSNSTRPISRLLHHPNTLWWLAIPPRELTDAFRLLGFRNARLTVERLLRAIGRGRTNLWKERCRLNNIQEGLLGEGYAQSFPNFPDRQPRPNPRSSKRKQRRLQAHRIGQDWTLADSLLRHTVYPMVHMPSRSRLPLWPVFDPQTQGRGVSHRPGIIRHEVQVSLQTILERPYLQQYTLRMDRCGTSHQLSVVALSPIPPETTLRLLWGVRRHVEGPLLGTVGWAQYACRTHANARWIRSSTHHAEGNMGWTLTTDHIAQGAQIRCHYPGPWTPCPTCVLGWHADARICGPISTRLSVATLIRNHRSWYTRWFGANQSSLPSLITTILSWRCLSGSVSRNPQSTRDRICQKLPEVLREHPRDFPPPWNTRCLPTKESELRQWCADIPGLITAAHTWNLSIRLFSLRRRRGVTPSQRDGWRTVRLTCIPPGSEILLNIVWDATQPNWGLILSPGLDIQLPRDGLLENVV